MKPDDVLPYPRLKHKTQWPSAPLSEEYLIPPEDKPRLLEQLYPFDDVPDLDATLLDIHENREFVVRDFKVVRENGINLLASPYYYNSGGSVIDWFSPDNLDNGDDDEDEDGDVPGVGDMVIQRVRPDSHDRLTSLMELQHEGPAFRAN